MACDDDATATTRVHRIYGRGLFDGLRMAGIANPGEFVNEAKLLRMSEGVTGTCRKVLDAVPISEAWPIHKVCSELGRQGVALHFDAVISRLNDLKEKGLVKEPQPGFFEKVAAKPRLIVTKAAPKEQPAMPEQTKPTPTEPLDRLGQVAVRLIEAASALTALASEIEAIALDSEARVEAAKGEGDKLRQLQALLKSIGGV